MASLFGVPSCKEVLNEGGDLFLHHEVTDTRGQVLPVEMLLQAGRCLLLFFLEAAVLRRRSWHPARPQRSPPS